jgi:hypothetical protein
MRHNLKRRGPRALVRQGAHVRTITPEVQTQVVAYVNRRGGDERLQLRRCSFGPPAAEAQLHTSASLDPSQMHLEHPSTKALPEQNIKELF